METSETSGVSVDTVAGMRALIQSLGDGLGGIDEQLLRDLRGIASEHEMRRDEILRELQVLADGIGFLLCAEPAGVQRLYKQAIEEMW
jgi:hypothetical protein